MYRLRVTFGRGEEQKYLPHLDLTRMLHRALRRAGVPVLYPQESPLHPRLALASPLAVGFTSEGELMDVVLRERMHPFYFAKNLSAQLPIGISITQVDEVPLNAPSLQSQVRWAEYRVTIASPTDRDAIEKSIVELMAKKTLPWEHQREREVRRYDLRPLIHRLWVVGDTQEAVVLGMVLKCHPIEGTGRPEQVAAALGLPEPDAVHRVRLFLEGQLDAAERSHRS